MLAAGPPLYLPALSATQRQRAWKLVHQLAQGAGALILDHHLLRCKEGLSWPGRLASQTDHRVVCAAGFMGHSRCLLEARRKRLYDEMPVPTGRHEAYARGETNIQDYR